DFDRRDELCRDVDRLLRRENLCLVEIHRLSVPLFHVSRRVSSQPASLPTMDIWSARAASRCLAPTSHPHSSAPASTVDRTSTSHHRPRRPAPLGHAPPPLP